MRTYTMPKIKGKPDWKAIPIMPIDNLLWTDSIDITAQSQICWDEEYIYIKQEAVESNIKMEKTDPLGEICEDSCLEFFLRPTNREEYLNIEYNPIRNIYLGYGRTLDTRVRILAKNVNELFNSCVEFTENGWVLTYQIPMSFIKMFFPEFSPYEGLKIYGNTYKCGDKTVKPHFLAWNPIGPGKPTFHRIECFGELIFGGYSDNSID